MQSAYIHENHSEIRCPNCGGTHLSKLSELYRQRLPALEGSISETNYTYKVRPQNVAKSGDPITQDLAPPRRASYQSIFLVALGFVLLAVLLGATRWFLTIWISGWVITVLVLWFGAYRHNTEQWPKKMSTWKQSLLCHSCGERFIPNHLNEAR